GQRDLADDEAVAGLFEDCCLGHNFLSPPPACGRGSETWACPASPSRSGVGLSAHAHPRPLPRAGGEKYYRVAPTSPELIVSLPGCGACLANSIRAIERA